MKLNPIQVNINEGGLHNNNQGGGTKICSITSRFWKLQYGLFCHTTSQLKYSYKEKTKYNSSSTRCNLLISFYSFFNSNL